MKDIIAKLPENEAFTLLELIFMQKKWIKSLAV
jgi:hypothetical protein